LEVSGDYSVKSVHLEPDLPIPVDSRILISSINQEPAEHDLMQFFAIFVASWGDLLEEAG